MKIINSLLNISKSRMHLYRFYTMSIIKKEKKIFAIPSISSHVKFKVNFEA